MESPRLQAGAGRPTARISSLGSGRSTYRIERAGPTAYRLVIRSASATDTFSLPFAVSRPPALAIKPSGGDYSTWWRHEEHRQQAAEQHLSDAGRQPDPWPRRNLRFFKSAGLIPRCSPRWTG